VRRVGANRIPTKVGEVEDKITFRIAVNRMGKPSKGKQHAARSGNGPKGGRLGICKSCVHGETGTVKPEFPRDELDIRHSLP
jgi:hypothetical protein